MVSCCFPFVGSGVSGSALSIVPDFSNALFIWQLAAHGEGPLKSVSQLPEHPPPSREINRELAPQIREGTESATR